MCKRGHPLRYISKHTGNCLLCGVDRTNKWRKGTPYAPLYRYRLKLDAYRTLKQRRRVGVVCGLAGVSYQTVTEWVRSRQHGGQALVSEESARRFAEAARMGFGELWEEVIPTQ